MYASTSWKRWKRKEGGRIWKMLFNDSSYSIDLLYNSKYSYSTWKSAAKQIQRKLENIKQKSMKKFKGFKGLQVKRRNINGNGDENVIYKKNRMMMIMKSSLIMKGYKRQEEEGEKGNGNINENRENEKKQYALKVQNKEREEEKEIMSKSSISDCRITSSGLSILSLMQKGEDFETNIRKYHSEIPNVLSSCTTEELNILLSSSPPVQGEYIFPSLIGVLLHFNNPTMRQRILDIIVRQRIHEISLDNRVIIVQTLQYATMSPFYLSNPVFYSAIRDVILKTKGVQLTLLKEKVSTGRYSITAKGSSVSYIRNDFNSLVYHNRNVAEKAEIIHHIAIEAQEVLKQRNNRRYLKVLSDIDDTLCAGWLDRRFPRFTLYPQVLNLYQRINHENNISGEMNHIQNNEKNKIENKGIDLTVFLTVRPRGWRNIGQKITSYNLSTLGLQNYIILAGSMKALRGIKHMVENKILNFRKFAALYPEFHFAFFGDSGQGDALVATEIMKYCPGKLHSIFLHDINPDSMNTGDGGLKNDYKMNGILFFQTHSKAALQAHENGILSNESANRIILDYEKELMELQILNETKTLEPLIDEMQQCKEKISTLK